MSSVKLKRICVPSIEIQGSSGSIPTSLLARRLRVSSTVLGRGFFSSTKCRDRLWDP